MDKKLQKAEQNLRRAAALWADGLHDPVVGSQDLAFKNLDNALKRAAVRYAEALKQRDA
jgi:hypothetical protein